MANDSDTLARAHKRHAHIPLSAIVLVLGASACFSTADVTVKWLSQRYPVPMLVWARWSVQFLLIMAVAAPKLRLDLVRTQHLPLHLLRGILLIVSSLCFFSAVKYLPLAEATALNYLAPLLVTLLAGTFLREHITRPRWAFVVAGIVGTLLIVRPGSAALAPAALFALGSATSYALFQLLTRRLAGESLAAMMFYPSMCGMLSMSVVVPLLHNDQWFPSSDLFWFLGIGVMGSIGHLLFIWAFKRASASAIAPFTYMQLVWSTLAGWIVFGNFPDHIALFGMAVIAGSGAVLAWYENREANIAAPAATD